MASKTLHFPSARHLHQLYAGREENLTLIEKHLGVSLVSRDDWLQVDGPEAAIAQVESLLGFLNDARTHGVQIRTPDLTRFVEMIARGETDQLRELFGKPLVVATNRKTIVPKTLGQKLYLQSIQTSSLVFGIGPAGTGKTYLAMAAAVSALLKNQVQRIILTRPAVEAGEALGFLPGDLNEKILPYLRPLYDAMGDMLDAEDVARLTEKGVIEIAPLAYMRGRTLSNSYVILDEAQNTTPSQMKMFLTRMGENSRMIITGDPSQTDLPPGMPSGLADAVRKLCGLQAVSVVRFDNKDVVRHPLVGAIIEAYEAAARQAAQTSEETPAAHAGAGAVSEHGQRQ
ncbi:MAG: PhoH family protein [Rariglobus sp.]